MGDDTTHDGVIICSASNSLADVSASTRTSVASVRAVRGPCSPSLAVRAMQVESCSPTSEDTVHVTSGKAVLPDTHVDDTPDIPTADEEEADVNQCQAIKLEAAIDKHEDEDKPDQNNHKWHEAMEQLASNNQSDIDTKLTPQQSTGPPQQDISALIARMDSLMARQTNVTNLQNNIQEQSDRSELEYLTNLPHKTRSDIDTKVTNFRIPAEELTLAELRERIQKGEDEYEAMCESDWPQRKKGRTKWKTGRTNWQHR